MIIKAAKRIFNSDKICHSYNDLNFGVTFLEHSVFYTNMTTLLISALFNKSSQIHYASKTVISIHTSLFILQLENIYIMYQLLTFYKFLKFTINRLHHDVLFRVFHQSRSILKLSGFYWHTVYKRDIVIIRKLAAARIISSTKRSGVGAFLSAMFVCWWK